MFKMAVILVLLIVGGQGLAPLAFEEPVKTDAGHAMDNLLDKIQEVYPGASFEVSRYFPELRRGVFYVPYENLGGEPYSFVSEVHFCREGRCDSHLFLFPLADLTKEAKAFTVFPETVRIGDFVVLTYNSSTPSMERFNYAWLAGQRLAELRYSWSCTTAGWAAPETPPALIWAVEYEVAQYLDAGQPAAIIPRGEQKLETCLEGLVQG